MAGKGALHVSGTENFDKQVKESDVPVLVDFFAQWCGPCKMAAPIMDKLADEYEGKAKVVKIDVDEDANRPVAMDHRVMSIPTVVMYQSGQVIDQKIGFIGEDGYRQMIESAL